MLIYFFTILVLFSCALIESLCNLSQGSKKILQSTVFIILVFQLGLRWETGTDWIPYFQNFKLKNVFVTPPDYARFEYGYRLMVWIIKRFSNSYSVFLIIHAIIYYLLIFKSFRTYSPFMFVSLMIFYSSSLGMMGSNRQMIALAICLYSLRYIIEKKTLYFFLFVFIAASFHITAILFGIYYFLNKDIKPFTVFILLTIAFVLGRLQLPLIIFNIAGKLLGGNAQMKIHMYLFHALKELHEYSLAILGFVKRLLFLSVFLYNKDKLKDHLLFYNLMLNGYMIGVLFYFFFGTTLIVMISRGSIFFNVMEPLLISSQIFLFKLKQNKLIIASFLLLLSVYFLFQSISAYPDLFIPYKGIFINSELKRLVF
jgi:hypothetical protein